MFKKIACFGLAVALLQSCVDIAPEQKSKLQAVKQTMPATPTFQGTDNQFFW